jgi:hypothetical protein
MITTTNFALSAALVSASAAETRLIISNPGMHAVARQGLRLPVADRDPVGGEVVAIGTCLQLVVAGVALWR